MAKGGFYPSRDFVGLSGVLKNHHTNIQALFRRYLGSSSGSRPAIVLEILLRLQSHLAMEQDVLLTLSVTRGRRHEPCRGHDPGTRRHSDDDASIARVRNE